MKKYFNIITCILIIIFALSISACSNRETATQTSARKDKPTLIFADAGWDSIRFHNDIAKFIIENGFGYKTDVLSGSTPVTFTGLRQGDIDIYMEVWTDNIIDEYNEAIKNGEVHALSVNFDDDMQGLYVPTYLIKGDPKRNIKALTPDLKTIQDLEKYWEVFKDPEDKSKGRIYGAIPGWAADEIMTEKITNYGLDKKFNLFRPGSDTALSTSIVTAYEKGEPWVGYYWEPTWIMGKYDMTLLKEEPYDKEAWEKGYLCEFPPVKVTVAVNSEIQKTAPEVYEFLKNYETSSTITSEALAYMQEKNVGTAETAIWFLQNNKDIWSKWLTAEVAQKIEAALK